MPLNPWRSLLLWREVGRERRPSLVLHERLHLVGVRLWWWVWVLWSRLLHALGHVGWHIRLVLAIGVVDGRLWHISKPIRGWRCRSGRADGLAHPPHVVSRRWP